MAGRCSGIPSVECCSGVMAVEVQQTERGRERERERERGTSKNYFSTLCRVTVTMATMAIPTSAL